MRILILTLAVFGMHSSMAATTTVKRLCYSGCDFDGYKAAQRTCDTVARSTNLLSNEAVRLTAVCRDDKDGSVCGENQYCLFPDVVLEATFVVP